MLTKNQIERNIAWLLDNASVPVLYLTHKYLLGTGDDTDIMRELWREVENSPDAAEFFTKQEADGSWCASGSWARPPIGIPKEGYSAFTPKYNTTAWILSLLGETGFTTEDEHVRKAFDYTMTYQWENGLFSRFKNPQKHSRLQQTDRPNNTPCELGVFLLGLGKVCGGNVAALEKSYSLLVDFQRDDGGWVLENHRRERKWTRSCPWSSYHATSALYHSKDPTYRDALIRGLKFLVWHMNLKENHLLQRFFYHGHSTIHELVMLSEYGIGLEERPVRAIIDWLMTMYDADSGCFRYTGKPVSSYKFRQDFMSPGVAMYRLYHLIETDWLTYYATRIGMNLLDKV